MDARVDYAKTENCWFAEDYRKKSYLRFDGAKHAAGVVRLLLFL
jgi:hypothetical protein